MTDFVANFDLEKNEIKADFELENPVQFDAILEINASPQKVSELENDLNFQTKTEVDDAIQAEADIINARIDEEVETLNTEINKKVETITGSDLIGVSREGSNVTITSKTFVFEQGIASDTWTIEHNLNKYPTVECVDSSGRVFKAQVEYNSLDSLTVYINGASKGKAYLN